jgi:transposase InsO family protein
MVYAAKLSVLKGKMKESDCARLITLLSNLGMPISCNVDGSELLKLMKSDKKREGNGVHFVYLTSIMDLYARKIIAWTLSDNMEVSCVINTINKAKERRNTDLPLIIHSDRGSQYVSKAYRNATEKYQLSYSHTGYPYDNACIESFHSLIKREWLNRFAIADYNQAYRLVFEYIETFYNTVRSHSHCDYMSPNDFEKLYMYVANDGIQKKAS